MKSASLDFAATPVFLAKQSEIDTRRPFLNSENNGPIYTYIESIPAILLYEYRDKSLRLTSLDDAKENGQSRCPLL